MWYDIYGILPTDRTKKKLTQKQNNLEFQNTFNRLINLSLNTFEWKGLPDTCDVRVMEQALLWRGFMCFYKDKDGNVWSYSAGPGGKRTKMGYASNGFWYALNGENGKCEFYWPFMDNTNANAVLCLDNEQQWPHIFYIMRGAERIADARRALDVAAQNSKFPYILQCSEEQKDTILSIFNDVYNNEPLIITQKNNDFANQTSVFNTNVREGIIKELWDYYQNTYSDVLETLGVRTNKNEDKKERMTIQEVSGSTDFVRKNIDYRLKTRQEFCDRVNEAFGLNISVDFKKDPEEVLVMNGNNPMQQMMGGNQDDKANPARNDK